MKFERLGKASAVFVFYLGTSSFLFNSCKHDGVPADLMPPVSTTEVVGIFANNCGSCHNGRGENGEYNFTNYDGIKNSGAITPGNSAKSKAYKAITSTIQLMPPNNALSTSDRTKIRLWIDQGAKP